MEVNKQIKTGIFACYSRLLKEGLNGVVAFTVIG